MIRDDDEDDDNGNDEETGKKQYMIVTSSGHIWQNSCGSLPCLRSLIFVTRSISVPQEQNSSNKMIPKLNISAFT